MSRDLRKLFGLNAKYTYWNPEPPIALVTELYFRGLPVRIDIDAFNRYFSTIALKEQPQLKNMMIHTQEASEEDSFGLELAINRPLPFQMIANIAERVVNHQIRQSGRVPDYEMAASCEHAYKNSIGPNGSGNYGQDFA